MSSYPANYGANAALAALFSGTRYLGLHLADPSALGLLSTEVAGGDYLRQLIKFSTPSGRAVASINSQRFPGMPACIVRFLAIWDAVSAGNLIYVLDLADFGLPEGITVAATAAFDAAPGDLAVRF